MKVKINTNLLELIPEHYTDETWVYRYADEIYRTMREMLKQRKLVGDVIKYLLLIYPAFLGQEDLRRWAKLANRAHKKMTRQELRRRSRPEYAAHQAYMIRPVAVERARPRRPRSDRLNQREMMEIYLSLMMSQVYVQPTELTQPTLKSTLRFASRINDQYYYNKLYQTLAYILLANAQFDKALDLGLLAFRYWQEHQDPLETALTVFGIALAYRGQGNWQLAGEWLEKATDLFAKTEYPLSYGIVAMETACTNLHLRNYPAAVQWSQIALREFQRGKMEYHVGLAYHLFGLAQAYDGQFDAAVNNLWRSINYWESVGNLLEQVHTEHSLAFTEALAGQKERAMIRLSRNRELCNRLSESQRKTRHLERVLRLERAIENDDDLLTLFL